MSTLKIGLFGFGTVGEGIYRVLSEKDGLGCEVKKVVIKHAEKERQAPAALFTTNADEVLKDPEIDLVVELIDQADEALQIVKQAIASGKSVVSANKKMIAENHLELIQLSKEKGVSFLYEGAVCGSVPIIRNLEEYFDNDLLTYVQGIVNGSTNFILGQMKAAQSYEASLQIAQESGFAESDPSLDVEGFDAAYKLSIITLHAFGKHVQADQLLRKGITSLNESDFNYAREKGYVIKLLAKSVLNEEGELTQLSVWPTFVPATDTLALTDNEYNAVLIGSSLSDEQFLSGKGAGRYPTSSAVLSDISAFIHGYQYEYKKGIQPQEMSGRQQIKAYVRFKKGSYLAAHFFEEVEACFVGAHEEYIIGTLSLQQLAKSPFLRDPSISFIAFN